MVDGWPCAVTTGRPAADRFPTRAASGDRCECKEQPMKNSFLFAALLAACLCLVMPGHSQAQSQTIRCESENQLRKHCPVDTRGGVRLARQMGRSTCTQGTNWDFDSAGVWVRSEERRVG